MTKQLLRTHITLGIIFTFLIFAFVLPLAGPTNTQYSGVKKEAAEAGVRAAWQMARGINYATITGTIKIKAVKVELGDQDSKWCNGDFISATEPEAGRLFMVTVSYHTLFDIPLDPFGEPATFRVCRSLQAHY